MAVSDPRHESPMTANIRPRSRTDRAMGPANGVPGPGAQAGPPRTADGQEITLLCNVASATETRLGLAAGAAGVGLLRTEIPFTGAAVWPTEADHRAALDPVIGLLTGRPVVVRLLDFSWLAMALTGLPAVLKKMSKIEMAALRNSDEGRRLSKQALQQRGQENMAAIAKVEELRMDELSDVVSQLYPGMVRVKVRPSPDHPRHVLIGSAYAQHFYDSPAALSQKYGVEADAGWTVLGQLNVPSPTGASAPQPIPTGNQMEDAFEQMALLMNNAFRLASAPAFPALSLTPIAIYRTAR